MNETVRYLISFLLYGNEEAIPLVGYTRDEEEAKKFKINILPSPNSPLYDPQKTWADFLPEVEQTLSNRTINNDVDIISAACFFLSRAEETVNTKRDMHGRLLAKDSLVGRHNLINIPLIDEYSRWLMKRLQLSLPQQGFSQVNLTHDIDFLTFYRHPRGLLGGIKRGKIIGTFQSVINIKNDPAYTYPWLIKQDKGFNSIYFIKATDGKGFDYPQYNLYGKDFKHICDLIRKSGAQIGLHLGYDASQREGTLIRKEKESLEKALGQTVCLNRYHWLRSKSLDNMQKLADAGITDDYSIGFADYAGFRLLTSRPVRWINPKSLQLTTLTLHPLTIMDCTLSNDNYMNLSEDEAYYACQQIIDKTYQNSGELTILWHNSIFAQKGYHKSLYPAVVRLIRDLSPNNN